MGVSPLGFYTTTGGVQDVQEAYTYIHSGTSRAIMSMKSSRNRNITGAGDGSDTVTSGSKESSSSKLNKQQRFVEMYTGKRGERSNSWPHLPLSSAFACAIFLQLRPFSFSSLRSSLHPSPRHQGR